MNMLLWVAALFTTGALITILAIAILNTLTFPRLRPANRKREITPKVSVLIPARDEAAVIASTISALCAQDYENFEIIVLDDDSQDNTAEIARRAATRPVEARHANVRVIQGAPLMHGWLGKNWACHQLAQSAIGDILIFTDADVQWGAGALAALVETLHTSNADMLTVWSTQITETWGERLVVPLMALVIMGYLPAVLVHKTRWQAFAAANGQCLAFRREAYEAIGGHNAVRAEIVEDIQLARRIKGKALRLYMLDGAGMITCRMYRGWSSVRDGYAKNIIAGYGGRVSFLLLATAFHWMLFLFPALWLIFGWVSPVEVSPVGVLPLYPVYPLALVGLGVGIRALTALTTRQRPLDALLMPISALLMTRIALHAIYWGWRGRVQWKGRTLT